MSAYYAFTYCAKRTQTDASDEEGFHTSAFCWGSGSGHTYCSLVVCWE